ncbi:methionyl-tRNA synthetase [Thermoanaerobaculum aquaticum]|uniref:Methionine--tRNA ligase n=1 Tax=Thermoanaerobaculum aquaticum TaxID=1312852 RepID=A0A062XYN1_9BACT|nr:methionine--tRNA ligase [Thermoanaerobaculum aquaticum]KDA53236.1 methionyl-tRNA synthetase [Thermoanaerobaculum aquaticum]
MARIFYITTPIYYVNDLPHIGHMYTTVVADVLARFKRMRGFEVFFLTGTDEHGQKIERAAREQGIPPQALADQVVGRYHELWRELAITHDDFIRTTQERHKAGVRELIRRMSEAGDIYKASYEGWYCSGCESFYPETQLKDGRCPDFGHPVERLAEESYFFRLSAYQEKLLAFYRENPDFVRPASRFNEVVRFVEGGLKDLSISRASLRWGIPWPGDDRHVVYVWVDALTNYISALGFGSENQDRFQRFWPADLHLVGKDILRFHCVYWPAFLMSAGLPLPKQVFGHGWWLKDEKKMSKSLGNVVRPDYLIGQFGADPLRYFFLREMTFGQDASFSDEGFLSRYNADLANGLGNTFARVMAMARRYFDGKTPPEACGESTLRAKAEEAVARYLESMEGYEFHRALEAVWELLSAVDGYVTEKAPWGIFKAEGASGRLSRIMYNCLESLRLVAVMISPVMPGTADKVFDALPTDDAGKKQLAWGMLPVSAALGPDQGPLFPKVDDKAFFAEVKVSEQVSEQGSTQQSELVSIEEFARIKLVVGKVVTAERVPKSKKLVRLEVDLGEGQPRQIVAGIGGSYQPEELVGKLIVVVANLKPATLMGVESRGMLLAATLPDGSPVLLTPEKDVPPGAGVK